MYEMERKLSYLSEDLLQYLQSNSRDAISGYRALKNFHQFFKVTINSDTVHRFAKKYGFVGTVQAEIVRVNEDLTLQSHWHEKAHAFVTILGPKQRFEEPKHAEVLLYRDRYPRLLEIMSKEDRKSFLQSLNGLWCGTKRLPTSPILIRPKTIHGFRIQPGRTGILNFLSVQYPAIDPKDGPEDFHLVVPE